MTHYLPAVGLLAAVAVVVFVGTLLIREDATTTDGTAAPERNERRAIATAEDPTTTDGTAAPERNEGTRLAADEPTTTDDTAAPGSDERGAISAAEFLGGQRSELARYQEVREDLVRVTGRLREVSNLDADTVWIAVDSIEGLEDHELLTATIKSPAPETDAVLERIGRNGQITLEGRARNTPGRVEALHMHEIRRINEHVVPATEAPQALPGSC